LASAGMARQVMGVRHPESVNVNRQQRLTRQYMGLEDSLWKDGKRFLLFSERFYLEPEYYSKHPKECVLLLQSDATQKGPWSRVFWTNLAQYFPLHLWELDDLKRHARETALILPSSHTLDAMRQAGFKVEVRFSKPIEVVYLQ